MSILEYRKIWYVISGALVVAGLVSLFTFGLYFGIDFTGGSLLELQFKNEVPSIVSVQEIFTEQNVGNVTVQRSGEQELLIRSRALDESAHTQIIDTLRERFGEAEELRFDSIGPSIGEELRRKATYAIVLVLLSIVLYVAWAFRKVSYPVSSWVYGLATLLAAFHDVLIVVGVFSVLGYVAKIEINGAFVAAILTIMGYSINDTIVVFDRIRENVTRMRVGFLETIGRSIRETLVRSLNTSLTTLFALLAIFFFGGESIRYFSLAMIIGIIVGTYSSLFIASPLLFTWYRWKNKS